MAITVTNTADSGAGSLRSAILAAQSGDKIRFAPSLKHQTITLTSGQLEIDKTLTIDATGVPGLTISGNNASRIFLVKSTATATLRNLSLTNGRAGGNDEATGAGGAILTGNRSGLTLVNCRIQNNSAGFGGGIYTGFRSTTIVLNSVLSNNDGTLAGSERGGGAIGTKSGGNLTVRGSSFTNNRGINGGAINNLLGQLLVENSVFLNNDSTPGGTVAIPGSDPSNYHGAGGAIYTDGANASGVNGAPGATGGTITIRGSRFEGNRGAGQGGALFLFAYPPDKVIVDNSYIANNIVFKNAKGDSLGGGLRHGNAELLLTNTSFVNNAAQSQGGGLWIGGKAPTNIANSTFSGNVADDGQGNGLGGAITIANQTTDTTTITNSTIAHNKAGFMGGAFWLGDQPVTLSNSIVAFNTGGNVWKMKQQTPRQLLDGGNNIEFPAPLAEVNDVRVVANSQFTDPKLASLQLNGGFAPTHALLQRSPAINKGNRNQLIQDERGLRRDIKPDIGAFELISRNLTFLGSGSHDYLVGSSKADSLLGKTGDDFLVGRSGPDQLIGHGGSDYFAYPGTSQRRAFFASNSRSFDQIKDFKVLEGDQICLDTNNDGVSDQPLALFNAGKINAENLTSAIKTAYLDADQKTQGNQKLRANQATFFTWERETYLAVNDRTIGFSVSRDLLLNLGRLKFDGRDANLGGLNVETYFA